MKAVISMVVAVAGLGGAACVPVSAGPMGDRATVQQASPASPQAPAILDIGSGGVAEVVQDIATVRADLEATFRAELDAKLLEFNKTVVNQSDIWINRGLLGVVAFIVVIWSRVQAVSHGYEKQRAKRLQTKAAEAAAYGLPRPET